MKRLLTIALLVACPMILYLVGYVTLSLAPAADFLEDNRVRYFPDRVDVRLADNLQHVRPAAGQLVGDTSRDLDEINGVLRDYKIIRIINPESINLFTIYVTPGSDLLGLVKTLRQLHGVKSVFLVPLPTFPH